MTDTRRGRRAFAIDWETGSWVEADIYIEKIFRDHNPEIDEVRQSVFDQRVEEIRTALRQSPDD